MLSKSFTSIDSGKFMLAKVFNLAHLQKFIFAKVSSSELEHFKLCAPQDSTHWNNRIRTIFWSCRKMHPSWKANNNYGILHERMITDLKTKIKFLRDQVASKDTYFHEEIKFLRQHFETSLSKQENSSTGFCNNCHGQHIPSNIINSDDSFIMTNYHTKATSSDNNIQTES